MSVELHNAIETIDLPKEINNKNDEIEEIKYEEPIETLTDDPLFCKLCNVKVTSIKILQRHLDGRKHRMRIERQGKIFACELCDVIANSEIQLNIHLNSTKHKSRLLKKDTCTFTEIQPDCKGISIIVFCVICIFINLFLLFKSSSV